MNNLIEIYNYGESERAVVTFPGSKSVELTSSDYYLTAEALSKCFKTLGYDVKVLECEGE
jgi:hypothetical protein